MAPISGCCAKPSGPGYKTPADAMKGPKEKILYVACIQPYPEEKKSPDYIATVDVDPSSPSYMQIIHRAYMSTVGDEIHHFGWNSCSSCCNDATKKRNKIIVPALGSDRIHIFSVDDPKAPKLIKVIQPEEVHALNASALHTTHCLPSGDIMISAMGDATGEGLCNYILIDNETNSLKGVWTDQENIKPAKFGYDFWYQPYWDTMISSEWGIPNKFKPCFVEEHALDPEIYGRSLNVFSWSKRKLTQIIDLGPEGITPLELRFLHEPTAAEGFVGCGYPGHIFRFFRKDDGSWDAEKVIHIAKKKVIGHAEPEIGGMTLDIVISMDDRFLYTNNWMHGDICQYDITDTRHPKLVGQIFLGGKLLKDGPLKLIDEEQPEPVYVKGRKLDGAPQMMQLSLDGKRLYVSTAVFTPWDKQFYLEHVNNGSTMVRVDVNTETGGLTLDPDFLVDFGKEPNGPILAHEIRYPGGDCTSDIFMKQPA
ncbi:unnamed protein product [Bemisia tabaci]|uniref:Methanethiol oxidase n=2 Tax=Bemisia tabaci TaxID=7038 RepID=A0A9P0AC30_BEMTA|nr:unnamed protein product [Bemisia tabaci]